MAVSVLIVEDDKNIADLLRMYLQKEGYTVTLAADGGEGLVLFREKKPDLVLLDVMMPVMDGWTLCKTIRGESQTPVIMLTAKSETDDKVTGLRSGADDYITKPFDPMEVLARVRSQLRRYTLLGAQVQEPDTYTIGGIELNDRDKNVTVDGQPIYENDDIKRRLCVIPDDWYYFPQWSIREMAGLYEGMYPNFSRERYEKMKEVFPLNDKQMIRRMSKGMQKQAAFWLTMCCMPEVLVLDEPVDGLDPVMRRQVWSLLMGDVAERGTTVLVSSHNLRELEDVCDHVGIMNKGKVLLERSLSDLQDNTVKLQVAFADGDTAMPEGMDIVHHEHIGRVHTYIVRGDREEMLARVAALQPILLEAIPLTLEEIFIYELGGEDYAVKEIVL